MNIIIVGAGEVGEYLAERLSEKYSHDIYLIERDEARVSELSEKLDVRVMTGDGTSVTDLEEANVSDCDVLFSVTSDQNTNLVSASLGKKLGADHSIARVHSTLQKQEWLFNYKEHFNIDYLFSSERLVAIELAKFVRSPDAHFVEELARGQIELQQIVTSENSSAIGQSLRDLDLPRRLLVGMVKRDGQVSIPRGDFIIQQNDEVTLLGGPNRLRKARRIFMKNGAPQKKSAVIFGANEYGMDLAQMLDAEGVELRIFETQQSLCARMVSALPDTPIINSDATDLDVLSEERIGEVDFFIAVTRDDEDNVMACLQAQSLGTPGSGKPHCLAMIQRGDYARIIRNFRDKLGLRGTISPREATIRDLMRFITSEEYHVVKKMDGGIELIELPVRAGSKLDGKRFAEAEIPRGSIIAAQVRGAQGTVPAADDVIEAGDTLYAIVEPAVRDRFIKLFRK